MRRPDGWRGMRATSSRRGPAAVALLFAALFVLASGAWGAFSGSVTPTHSTSSGTVSLSLPSPGSGNRMTLAVDNLYPGNPQRERIADLTNNGTVAFKTITVTPAVTTSSALDTEGATGIEWEIHSCNDAWTEAGVTPNFTYTCANPVGGTDLTVASQNNFVGMVPPISLTAGSNLAVSGVSHYRFRFALDSATTTATQSASTQVTFTFNATQRDPASK